MNIQKKEASNFFKSLRFRILVILVILGFVPCIVVAKVIIHTYEDRAVSLRISNVKNHCDIVCNKIAVEDYLENPVSEDIASRLETLSNVYSGRLLLIDQDYKVVRDTYQLDEGKTMLSADAIRCFRGENISEYHKDSRYLELTMPIQDPEEGKLEGVMLFSVSTNEIFTSVQLLQQQGILILGIVAALSVVLGFVLSGYLVKPLARVTKSIEDLTDGYQKDAISVTDYTETELITDAFNKVLNRMKVLDDSRQEFVSNVSHELKTPLTSMKVLADSLVGQENVPEELYQEFMRDITEEIDRESEIITDLLTLVKMDKKASDLNIEHMHINELLESILKRLRPIADQRNIDLILESFRPVEADVDEVKFTLAISNLVENGIKYNVEDGWVRVTLDADHKYFYVTVADSGMGIPEDSLERIFERFYRMDKSHSREIGGTGLGLAITRSAVAMHHGVIKVFSREDEGTSFSVRIPLSYIPNTTLRKDAAEV